MQCPNRIILRGGKNKYSAKIGRASRIDKRGEQIGPSRQLEEVLKDKDWSVDAGLNIRVV